MLVSQDSLNQFISYKGISSGFTKKISKNVTNIGVPAAVSAIMIGQTYMDIKDLSEPDDRKNKITNNILIGIAMLSGGFVTQKTTEKFLKNFKPGKYLQAINDRLPIIFKNYPKKEFLAAISIPIGAGIAGGITGEMVERLYPVKDTEKELLSKLGILGSIDYELMDRVYKFDQIGATKSYSGTMATMLGYTVSKQKGVKNKVKKFVFELISGVLIPVAVMLPTAALLDKKITNKHAKALIFMGIGTGLSMIGKGVANFVNKKVTERLVEHKIWSELSAYQKLLLKKSLYTHNPVEKSELLEKVDELTTFKIKIKDKNK